ncbi:hypothetical protein A0H81_00576 [Grifola frondosa]|uniref:RING-type domain-containing protein n=1 Tax=Grifola frondosa TaxID=5627 RepID=A0A1C7MR63_GRIFR|nr:hypothetical protein A0H81_00576 [Grifola frondosa]
MIRRDSSASSSWAVQDADDPNALLALVAQLSLEDIDLLQAGRKGKAKDTVVTDEELALQLLAEDARALLNFTKDMAFARSLDRALDADYTLVEELARAEADARADREMAVALSDGRPPPYRSPSAASSRSSSPLQELISLIPEPPRPSPSRVTTRSVPSSSKTTLSSSPLAKPPVTVQVKLEDCVICRDRIRGPVIRAPCGDTYDVDCLVSLFRASTVDESLFPPSCCRQPFVLGAVQRHLDADLLALFTKKAREFSTPTACTATALRAPPSSAGALPSRGHGRARNAPRAPARNARHLLTDLMHAPLSRTRLCSHSRRRRGGSAVRAADTSSSSHSGWDERRLFAAAEDRVQRGLPAGAVPAPVATTNACTHGCIGLALVLRKLWALFESVSASLPRMQHACVRAMPAQSPLLAPVVASSVELAAL